MRDIPEAIPKGILHDVEKFIDEALHIQDIGGRPHYRHKAAYDRLSLSFLASLDVCDLLHKIYRQIETNWKARTYRNNPSKENWRFKPQPKISPHNKGLEIKLQKAIIRIRKNASSRDATNWVNHIPTASGLWDHKCDKHRAIDLVHLLPGKSRYDEAEFIELKVDRNSGHPLHAAIEVLLYGVLYIFSRRHFKDLQYDGENQPLLQAKTIHLVVLAPFTKYYADCKLDCLEMLENKIMGGVERFVQASEGYKMDFQFQAFPLRFGVGGANDEDIIQALEKRVKGSRSIWLEKPSA